MYICVTAGAGDTETNEKGKMKNEQRAKNNEKMGLGKYFV
jgi:hypothetical protein